MAQPEYLQLKMSIFTYEYAEIDNGAPNLSKVSFSEFHIKYEQKMLAQSTMHVLER